MNIGTLTTTLGLDASGAITAMTRFERQMLASVNKIQIAVQNLNTTMNRVGGGVKPMTPVIDDKPAIKSVKNIQSSLAGLNSGLQRFGYLATTTLTLPLVLAGKAVFTFAKDYEYAMQKIVGLTGVAQSAVNDWSKEILAIGPQLGRTPKELIDALYFISSSGIKGAEAMNVLKLSAKAATAGLGTTQTVADLLTSTLNAYAGTGLTAAYATDVLVAGVREGKAEAEGFASAMGQIIPIAAQLGVSFDQVAGGMAAITLSGASSANAAVYLKGVFNSLLKASSQGEKALNSVGTSYAELRNILSQQGLIALMQKLRDIQMKYGDELLSDVLPNIRALTGYLSLAGKNFKYNTELMKRVTESTGSLGRAFAAVSDTIKVRYDKAISQAQTSMILLGKSVADSVLPFLEKLVKKLEETTTWFNSLSESGKKLALTIGGIAAALGPFSLLVSAFVWIIRGLIVAVGWANKAFIALRGVMMSNPWIAAATAVLLVVGALTKYKQKVNQLARDHDSFNTTLVSVNGTLKKLRDLLPTDYGSMTLNELSAAQEAARKEWVAAEKLWKQGLKNKENFSWLEKVFGANRNNDRYMQEQSDKITQLKKQYEELGDSYYDVWKKSLIAQQIKDEEKLNATLEIGKQRLKEQQDALDSLNLSWAEHGNLIKMATLASKDNKDNWWLAAKDKDKNDLLNTKIPDRLRFGTLGPIIPKPSEFYKKGQEIPMPEPYKFQPSAEALPLTEMEKFDKELGLIALKNKTFGESFNSTREQLNFFKATLSDLWDIGMRPGNQVMDDLIKRMTELNRVAQVSDILEGAFTDLFSASMDEMKNFESFIKSWGQSVLQAFQRLAAQLIAQKLVGIIFGLATGGGSTMGNMLFNLTGGFKGAQGGVVPSGYPNDTYPALLTSGETVIPKGITNLKGQGQIQFAPVEFVIKENELVGILRKANTRKSLY